jgi:hypothetical protein
MIGLTSLSPAFAEKYFKTQIPMLFDKKRSPKIGYFR